MNARLETLDLLEDLVSCSDFTGFEGGHGAVVLSYDLFGLPVVPWRWKQLRMTIQYTFACAV